MTNEEKKQAIEEALKIYMAVQQPALKIFKAMERPAWKVYQETLEKIKKGEGWRENP